MCRFPAPAQPPEVQMPYSMQRGSWHLTQVTAPVGDGRPTCIAPGAQSAQEPSPLQ